MFEGIFGGKKEPQEEKAAYTGEQELHVSQETGEVKSPELEEIDKTFDDR